MEILKMFYTLGVQIACLGINCKVYSSLSRLLYQSISY